MKGISNEMIQPWDWGGGVRHRRGGDVGASEEMRLLADKSRQVWSVLPAGSAVLALAWPGSQGFGLAFLGFGFTKP